jgi:hypothetical protein
LEKERIGVGKCQIPKPLAVCTLEAVSAGRRCGGKDSECPRNRERRPVWNCGFMKSMQAWKGDLPECMWLALPIQLPSCDNPDGQAL